MGKISNLQKLGRRLDQTYYSLKSFPKLKSRFINYITPQFLSLINTNPPQELEDKIINGVNSWLDLLEMEINGIFESNIK
jgi:hypothetical protein